MDVNKAGDPLAYWRIDWNINGSGSWSSYNTGAFAYDGNGAPLDTGTPELSSMALLMCSAGALVFLKRRRRED